MKNYNLFMENWVQYLINIYFHPNESNKRVEGNTTWCYQDLIETYSNEDRAVGIRWWPVLTQGTPQTAAALLAPSRGISAGQWEEDGLLNQHCWEHWCLDWMSVPPTNPSVETLVPTVLGSGGGACERWSESDELMRTGSHQQGECPDGAPRECPLLSAPGHVGTQNGVSETQKRALTRTRPAGTLVPNFQPQNCEQ